MQEQTAFAASLAVSAAPVQTFHVILAVLFLLSAAVTAAAIGIAWRSHRDMKTWAARRERQHQEDMISLEIEARRRREEHTR